MQQGRHYARSNYSARKKGPKKAFAIIGCIFIIGILVAVFFYVTTSCSSDHGNVKEGQEIQVTIPQGSTTEDIGKILSDKGVIASASDFTKRVKELKQESALQSGTYHFIGGDDYDKIIKMLTSGQTGHQLVIPEGLTAKQISVIVEQTCGINADEFYALTLKASDYAGQYQFLQGVYNDSMEGFLYPDTYRVDDKATADDVIRMMLDQFASQITTVNMSYAESKNLTLYDVVTLASMVEKEFKTEDDKPKIAAVFYNRLHERIPLGSDVTTYYAVGKDLTEDLTQADLASDSPYNTRNPNHYGLPAGPICNPSVSSIKAAANPEIVNYLYFFYSNKEGKTMYFENDKDFYDALGVYGDN